MRISATSWHLDLAGRARAGLERDGVERALDAEDARLGLLGAELEGDELARAERLVVDPEDAGREGPRLVGLVPGRCADLAPLDEELVLERDGDLAGRPGPGPWEAASAAGQVSIDFTRLRLPPGTNSIGSPTETLPDSTRPATIRRASKR